MKEESKSSSLQRLYDKNIPLRERMLQDEEAYEKSAPRDPIIDWDNDRVNFDKEGKRIARYVPNYTSAFTGFLRERLCRDKPFEIGLLLDNRFPNADEIDCDYLEDIQNDLNHKGPFSTRYLTESMGVIAERFYLNLDRVMKWLLQRREKMSADSQEITSVKPSSEPELGLEWHGTITSLAVLMYKLDKAGKIDLRGYLQGKGKIAPLARSICSLFIIEKSRSKDPVVALSALLGKLKPEHLGPGKVDSSVLTKVFEINGNDTILGDVMPDIE